jgi:hypothetical protein
MCDAVSDGPECCILEIRSVSSLSLMQNKIIDKSCGFFFLPASFLWFQSHVGEFQDKMGVWKKSQKSYVMVVVEHLDQP